MIDYSKWPRKRLSVVSLKLDDQNPRLPGVSPLQIQTQPKIIDYLIDHEGAYDLAKAIVTQGYLLNEEPIVCKEGNKMVVLEGNRRVTACKLIINPDLIKSKPKRKILIELIRGFDLNIITKLEVRIAPDRDSADILIVNRHTDGAAIERWDKTKQDRFFYNRVAGGETIDVLSVKFNIKKATIKETLMRYSMYNELLQVELNENERKSIEDETKFTMTNVERFYTSKLGKEFLGISFNENGQPIHSLPKEEYQKRLKRIALDVVAKKLNSRIYGDEKDQVKYVDSLKAEKQFNFELQPNKNFQSEYLTEGEENADEKDIDAPSVIKPKTIKPISNNKLIANDCNFVTGTSRIDTIFKELKSANLDTQFNSAAVLFRSYVDMIVYQFLVKSNSIQDIIVEEQQKLDADNRKRRERISKYIVSLGISETDIKEPDLIKAVAARASISKDWIPSLKQMLVYISKSSDLLPDARFRQALSSYVKGNSSYLDHNDFNLLVHNEYFLKGSKDLKEAWEQLYPLITYINQQLSK